MGRIKMPVIDRFNSKINKVVDSGCWEWTDNRNRDGYGLFKFNGKTSQAHRVSYKIFKGGIPEGLLVCHHCDNPCCVNPTHLFLGTVKDNDKDSRDKGRQPVSVCPSVKRYLKYKCRCDGCIQACRDFYRRIRELRKLRPDYEERKLAIKKQKSESYHRNKHNKKNGL